MVAVAADLRRDPDVELLNQRGQRVSADRAGLESLLNAAHRNGHIALDVTLDQITQRFLEAMPGIHRAIQNTEVGFWHIHANGRITKMWP